VLNYLDSNIATIKRELTIFYVLDTSGSMVGTPIATLNRTMTETVEALKSFAKSLVDVKLKIAVLEFNTGCRWMSANGPEEIEKFHWEDLSAGGLTDVGITLRELNSKLSRSTFLQSMTEVYSPIIIFMTDGFANEGYEKELKEIRDNIWFTRAIKVGFAIGENANLKLCENFTGDKEMVLTAYNEKAFRRILDAATISTGALMDDEDENSEITESEIATLKDAIKNEFESDFTDENDGSLAGDVRILVNDDDFKWDSDWDEEILSEYRIEGKTMRFNETYDVCVCQFGKSMPNEALNAVYKVSVAYQNKLTVKNVSDKCREVIVRLKPGEAIEISKPDSIGLTYGNQTVPIYTGSWSEFDWTPDGSGGTWE